MEDEEVIIVDIKIFCTKEEWNKIQTLGKQASLKMTRDLMFGTKDKKE